MSYGSQRKKFVGCYTDGGKHDDFFSHEIMENSLTLHY